MYHLLRLRRASKVLQTQTSTYPDFAQHVSTVSRAPEVGYDAERGVPGHVPWMAVQGRGVLVYDRLHGVRFLGDRSGFWNST